MTKKERATKICELLKTDYPEELADMIMFLTDVWMNPIIFQISEKQGREKHRF